MKDERPNYLCGIGSWRPKCLQWMATPSIFVLLMSITSLIQGGSYAYYIASLTTLEKRFAFSSTISGFILIADDVTGLLLAPVFGYMAHRLHLPRLIGFSFILVGIGSYVAALPYFIYGPAIHLLTVDPITLGKYTINRTVEFCDINNEIRHNCKDNSGSAMVVPAVVLIWLGCFLNGLGSTCYYTVGVAFIDDSVKKKNSPLYLSSTGAIRILGPTIAFMLSSLCLSFYENPFIDPGIRDRTDPRWVGAWWIGFLIMGTAIIISALPLFLFPAELNKNVKHEPNAQKTKGLFKVKQNNDPISDTGVWVRLKRLIKNPIYVCYVIGTNARLFAVLGYWTFKAKYIESAYKKSASSANLFTGIIGVVPTATGIFLGGFFIQCFQPRPRILTSFITIVEVLALMGMLSALFLGCPTSEFAGRQDPNYYQMQSVCNGGCHCSQKTFQPICGPNQRTNYFSPCFAGCSNVSLIRYSNKTNEYNDCECFGGTATEGYCETDCGNNFSIFLTLLGVSNIIGNLAKTGNSIISFRIVDPIDKSFAVGLAGAFFSVFAFLPYPLVYGYVTDSACLIWEESCGRRGNCWVYDTDKFRNYLHGMTVGLYLIGSVFDVIVIILSNRIKNLYDDEKPDQDQNSKFLNSGSVNHQELEIF